MSSSLNPADGIPSNKVSCPLGDLELAMWANPNLVVLRVEPGGALHGVLGTTLDFSFAKTSLDHRKI
ncbi:MAG: hypothetical protein RI933_555 [Actinomycetota bacterium]|jgi:hypothetical protein